MLMEVLAVAQLSRVMIFGLLSLRDCFHLACDFSHGCVHPLEDHEERKNIPPLFQLIGGRIMLSVKA